jgi:cyclopropane fatty-acyl-phospholipid synthase-like methyltransferase
MSGRIVPYFSGTIVPQLGDVAARLQSGTGVFLDVGAGVAAVTIGMCERFPAMRAIALEPAEAPLRLVRRRVAQAGLGDRIDLRQERAEDLTDVMAADLIWVAGYFIPGASLPSVFAALYRAMRPGAWLACGSMDPAEANGRSLGAALHAVAVGQDLPGAQAMTAMLQKAGFAEIRADPKLPNGIVPLYARRSPEPGDLDR